MGVFLSFPLRSLFVLCDYWQVIDLFSFFYFPIPGSNSVGFIFYFFPVYFTRRSRLVEREKMRYPLLLPLFLSLVFFFPSIKTWEENEPGFHEVTHFDWLVRENERAKAISIAGSSPRRLDLNNDDEVQADSLDAASLERCTVYDLEFWENVLRSEKQLSQSVTRFEQAPYFDMFIFQNVSVMSTNKVVLAKGGSWSASGGTPEFIDSRLSFEVADEDLSFPLSTPHAAAGFLGTVKGIPKRELEHKCKIWIEEPLYILASFDPANWFHFVERAVIPSFTYYGVAQPYFSTRNPQIATLRWPAKQEYNVRKKEVYPTWNALPEVLEKMLGGKLRAVPEDPFTTEEKEGECYRTVAWGLADKLFVNIQNLNRLLERTGGKGCFSPIVRSAADVLRSVMGVPYVRGPFPTVTRVNMSDGRAVETQTVLPIRVVYMKRSQGEVWTRHQGARGLANQEELIEFLAKKCREHGLFFEALEFFYTDMKNAQEQIRAIGRATVMVGIHGAGLAGMIAMPPGSSVVELRLKNANLRDNHFVFLSGAMGHKYLQVRYSPPAISEDRMELLWDTIATQTQIDELAQKNKHKKIPAIDRERPDKGEHGLSIEVLRQRREERKKQKMGLRKEKAASI